MATRKSEKKSMKVAGNNEQGMMAEGINTRQGLKKKEQKQDGD